METVLAAVLPVFGLIWLGFAFKRMDFPGEAFWPLAEKLTYYLLLPALFFDSILKADFTALDNISALLAAVVLGVALTSAAVFTVQRTVLDLDGPRFASFYQGCIRFNNYIGIPIVIGLTGQQGLVIYAIIIGLAIPLSNALTIGVMAHYASDTAFSWRGLLRALFTNPLIIGSLAGLVVNIAGIPLPYLGQMIHFCAQSATTIGLLCVGAGIDFAAITSAKRTLSIASALKLLLNPLSLWLACTLLGVTGLERDVAVIYGALPVAASSYILAKQFGAHAPLMASIVITTTLAAMATLPLVLLMVGG